MSNSSHRSKDYDTVHHITSRIAHRVRFLQEEAERNDLIEMIRRAADFTGVKLLGWCIMINHFHILAYLPAPADLSDEELIRRYGALKGASAANALREKVEALRLRGESGKKAAYDCLADVRKRMYSVGSFMKIVKQWFSEEYNRRNGHRGTLWEGAYYDRIVPCAQSEMRKCLGYIHLNPIRAAACSTFDGYAWSSYSAFKRGDDVAVAGMRFLYGDKDDDGGELTLAQISDMHEALLDALLEGEKRRRAEEIALKRLHGYDLPDDPLTDEALVNQARAHLKEVQKASMNLRLQRDGEKSLHKQRSGIEEEIVGLLTIQPGLDIFAMVQSLSIPRSTLYRYLLKMKRKGLVEQTAKGRWSKSQVRF